MSLGSPTWIIGNESSTHPKMTKKRIKELKEYYWPFSKLLFPEYYKQNDKKIKKVK
jgi:hypothetical protein